MSTAAPSAANTSARTPKPLPFTTGLSIAWVPGIMTGGAQCKRGTTARARPEATEKPGFAGFFAGTFKSPRTGVRATRTDVRGVRAR